MLYIVGTPIGNLGDFSPRAREILETVDVIACEDTRRTGLLLSTFSIHNTLVSYHSHNRAKREAELLHLLRDGKNVAIVTDAGMPCISDPGEELINICRGEGLDVSVIPGPSAVTTALSTSGFNGRRFFFEGFLPSSGGERKSRLEALAKLDCTFLLFEAPHRLLRTLSDLKVRGFGDRRIAFCREMTKKFEEVLIYTVDEAISAFQEKTPKGEFVLVVEVGEPVTSAEKKPEVSDREERIRRLIREGLPVKEIAQILSAEWRVSKKEVYRSVLDAREQVE